MSFERLSDEQLRDAIFHTRISLQCAGSNKEEAEYKTRMEKLRTEWNKRRPEYENKIHN